MNKLIAGAFVCGLLLLAACVQSSNSGWSDDQKAVFAVMRAWSDAASKGDTEAMWSLLSPDAQETYQRELEGVGGARQTVRLARAALEPGSLAPAEERKRNQAVLESLPENPEAMTPAQWFTWRTKRDLTPQATANTARLFESGNVSQIDVQAETAIVVLRSGEPDRYAFRKTTGSWKFDLRPSILRVLDETRRREADRD